MNDAFIKARIEDVAIQVAKESSSRHQRVYISKDALNSIYGIVKLVLAALCTSKIIARDLRGLEHVIIVCLAELVQAPRMSGGAVFVLLPGPLCAVRAAHV